MKMRKRPPKRWTKTEARRWSAWKNAQRGDPSNLSVHAFEIDRMRAYYRGRRPDGLVVSQMMRRWESEDARLDAICAAEGCDCQLSAVEVGA